jgi:hypothetical protein
MFAIQDTAPGLAAAAPDVPVLTAYADGRTLWAWCEHERCWHQHGAGGADRKSAHCTCPASPYRDGGYRLHVTGPLTPAVIAAHPLPAPCAGCEADGECSCGETRCVGNYGKPGGCYGGSCARHGDDWCAGCWAAHGGPGYGYCRRHGFTRMHSHARVLKWCITDYLAPAGSEYQPPCELAQDITRYWPAKDQPPGIHLHCPVCAAEAVLLAAESAALGAYYKADAARHDIRARQRAMAGTPAQWEATAAIIGCDDDKHAVRDALARLSPDQAAAAALALAQAQARVVSLCPGCRELVSPAWLAAWEAQAWRREMPS